MMYHVLPKSLRPARYFAPVALLAFVPLAAPFAGDYFPPPDAKGGWRTLTDPAKIAKTAGIDKQKLDEAFDYVQNTSQHGGLLVVRHGYLVYERYFGRGNREALTRVGVLWQSLHQRSGRDHAAREGVAHSQRTG